MCKVKKCENQIIKCRGYCNKHYLQIIRFGKTKRTQKDKNNIYYKNGNYIMDIYNKDSKKIGETIIDKNKIKEISEYKWHFDTYGYIRTSTKIKGLYLHQLILPKKEKFDIDHINGNILDNRKKNLRHILHRENIYNAKISKNNTSGITGVVWDKERNMWMAQLHLNRKHIFLGRYNNKKNAIKARLKAEDKYFREGICIANKKLNEEKL